MIQHQSTTDIVVSPTTQALILGTTIQELRRRRGLTQEGLCFLAGLSHSTLAKIEQGRITAPSVFTIWNIASVLGVSMQQLVDGVI